MQIEGYRVHFLQINWHSKKSCCSILKFFKVSPGHTVKDMELFDTTVSPPFSSQCICTGHRTPLQHISLAATVRWYAPLKAKRALNANLIIMIHENIANICPAIIDGTWLIVLFLGI